MRPCSPAPYEQEVISNLMVGAIEFRTEQDPDVARYTHPKDVSGECSLGRSGDLGGLGGEDVLRGTCTPRTSVVRAWLGRSSDLSGLGGKRCGALHPPEGRQQCVRWQLLRLAGAWNPVGPSTRWEPLLTFRGSHEAQPPLACAFHAPPPTPAVMVVHASREAEQLRSQLLGLIRNALQPLLHDRVGGLAVH